MTNVLLITADDMDGRTPATFGGPVGAFGVTPHLDRLAAEGLSFRRGHVPVAVCQPSRSALMTGLWPHRNGAEGFEPVDDGVELLTDRLHGAGHLAGILGKVDHLQPVDRFRWDFVRGMGELGLGRSPSRYGEATREFLAVARDQGRPWFLMANAHDPHRPFHASESERQKWSAEERARYPSPTKVFAASDVDVPEFLPDLPDVRREYAEYLSSARRCDDVVGSVLEALELSGETAETLVVFLSDNGMAFPFAKANCYLRSTLTPLIIRWPGVTHPGATEDAAFVSTLDLFPTFCEAIGVPAPNDLDGRSLTPLLRGEADVSRHRVFSVFHETSAKERYEMRCTQDAQWGYIWNNWADGHTTYRAENMEGLTWSAMREASSKDGLLMRRVEFYERRAAEELYDLRTDPACLSNRATDATAGAALNSSRTALAQWMAETQDPLEVPFRCAVLAGSIRS